MKRLGLTAIDRLNAVIERGPAAPYGDIRDAVDCIIAWRNRAIEGHRAGTVSRPCLDRANSLASLAFGSEFPLSGFHLNRIRQTRDSLKEFVRGEDPAAVRSHRRPPYGQQQNAAKSVT